MRAHAARTHRTPIAAAAGTAAAVLLGAGLAATASQPATAATTVDMEKVVLAAQLDPAKNGTDPTDGAAASVKAVEQALADAEHLDAKHVDGHFGSATVTAYSAWQKSQGASGEAANGLPGTGTMKKLGDKGGFTVTNTIDLGKRTTVDGQTLNQRTADMLAEAEKISGVDLHLTQGSYEADGADASAGTHDGGGALDAATKNLSPDDRAKAVTALRQVGFAAWDRTGVGTFDPHIHAVAISDTDLDSSVWKKDRNRQIFDYYNGMDGLTKHGPDNGPNVAKQTWEDYQRSS